MATLKKEGTQQEQINVTNNYNKFITRMLIYQSMKPILKE